VTSCLKTSDNIDSQSITAKVETLHHSDWPASHPTGHSVPEEGNTIVSSARFACFYAPDLSPDE